MLSAIKRTSGAALQRLPFALQRVLLEHAAQRVLSAALESGALDSLQGRVVRVRCVDFDLAAAFRLRDRRVRLMPPSAAADVEIAADSCAFALLAAGEEDPDSLFFRRRLSIEGDTALGLELKNLLDSIGALRLPSPLLQLLRHAAVLHRPSATPPHR